MSRLLLLALAALLAPAALAQTCTTSWTNPAGGVWEFGNNWDNGLPTQGSVACITLPGTYTVSQIQVNIVIRGLVVGGASGIQTLKTKSAFIISGDAAVRPNARWEFLPERTADAGIRMNGLFRLGGTLTIPRGVSFLRTGGTLDIAPGGTLRVVGSNATLAVGSAAGAFRIRGLLEATDCPATPASGTCQVDAPLDVQGGTVRAAGGVLFTRAGGTLAGATLDAATGASLYLRNDAAPAVPYIVTGTLSGAPAGAVFVSGANLAAGTGGATLAIGGTGLQLGGLANTTLLTSAGGSFVNTGLLVRPASVSNFSGLREVILRNRGVIELPTGLGLYASGLLVNEPTGVIRATGTGRISGDGTGTGRFENAGLFELDAPGATFGFGDGGSGQNSGPYSRPGSEIRVLRGRLELTGPGPRNLPDGVSVTGGGTVGIPTTFSPEGTFSPGTADQPLATLTISGTFRPSLVTGTPRLVIDVDAGGLSDRLDALAGPGSQQTRLAGVLIVRLRPGYVPAIGDAFTVLTSASATEGQFSQVVAENAPSGIAFVTERSADGKTLTLRAVATAPGGAVTVSTTRPVAGGVRSLFLTGPGAVGVALARLECTTCLDPAVYGMIPAALVGTGALKEARFDLTSPRAFGLYDLVMVRPGLADERVPITVRPYVSYIQTRASVTRGIGVRPASTGRYNWSVYDVFNTTNTAEPSYAFAAAGREDRGQVDIALASGNPFGIGVVFYESRTAPDPTAGALTFACIPSGESVPLSYGQSIDPGQVLFPDQTATGPDDPRIAFGENRIFNLFSVQHTSFARAVGVVELTLRSTQSAALTGYLAQVDAADAGAVRAAIGQALESAPRYVGGTAALLDRTLAGMNATAPTPAGLSAQTAAEFARTLDAAAFRLYADLEYAYRIDLATAAPAVQALLQAEYAGLGGARPAGDLTAGPLLSRGGTLGNVCRVLTNAGLGGSPTGVVPPSSELINNAALCIVQNIPPPRPPDVPVPAQAASAANTLGNTVRTVSTSIRTIVGNRPFGDGAPFAGGSCPGGGAGGGAGGGGGGGGSCTPPAAPADPNDKTADTNLRCQFGTVTVGGVQQTRCVRYFVPLAEAQAPVQYSIQFENLPQATANAEFVTVTDTLDASFNPATLRVLATSSDSTFTYSVAGQVVTFRFTGIDLPPNRTAPEGQGFITYEVTPRPTVTDGSVLRNRASIVFDFNPAIATPEVVHEVRQTADVSAVISAPDFVVVGQPQTFSVVVANTQGDAATDAAVTIDTGGLPGVQVTTTGGTCSGTAPVVCTFGTLAANAFERITVTSATAPVGQNVVSATATTSAFDGFAANDSDAATLTVATVAGEGTLSDLPRELTLTAPWPNPARGTATLRWGLPAATSVDVRVYDLLGREVAVLADETQEAGWHEARWDARVASGVYLVRVRVGGDVRTRRMTVIR